MFKHRSLVGSSMHRSRGFTIIELMVTIVLVAILVAMAIPSFQSFIAGQKVKTASFELGAALLLARNEAANRKGGVTLAANPGGWAAGWTISITSGTTTTVLSEQAALPGVAITAKNAASDDVVTSVAFDREGRPTYPGHSPSRFVSTIQISPESAAFSHHRCISVDLTGMISTKREACPS